MRNLFSVKTPGRLNDLGLLILRVSLSAFMLTHGLPKLSRLLEGNADGFPDPLGIGSTMSLVLAVIGEALAPVMIIPGLMTRLATIPVITAMSVAAFIVHSGDPFGGIRIDKVMIYGHQGFGYLVLPGFCLLKADYVGIHPFKIGKEGLLCYRPYAVHVP